MIPQYFIVIPEIIASCLCGAFFFYYILQVLKYRNYYPIKEMSPGLVICIGLAAMLNFLSDLITSIIYHFKIGETQPNDNDKSLINIWLTFCFIAKLCVGLPYLLR